MALTPEQRTLRARAGAYAMHANNDSDAIAANARKGYWRKFEDEVDPERVLPAAERQRRAEQAMKAHMTKLALASSIARSKKAAAKRGAA